VSVSQYGSKQRREVGHEDERVVDGCRLTVAELQLPSQVDDENGCNINITIISVAINVFFFSPRDAL